MINHSSTSNKKLEQKASLLERVFKRKLFIIIAFASLLILAISFILTIPTIDKIEVLQKLPQADKKEVKIFLVQAISLLYLWGFIFISLLLGYTWVIIAWLMPIYNESFIKKYVTPRLFIAFSKKLTKDHNYYFKKKTEWNIATLEKLKGYGFRFIFIISLLLISIPAIYRTIPNTPLFIEKYYTSIILTMTIISWIIYGLYISNVISTTRKKIGLTITEAKQLLPLQHFEYVLHISYIIPVIYGMYLPLLVSVSAWHNLLVPRIIMIINSIVEIINKNDIILDNPNISALETKLHSIMLISGIHELFEILLPLLFILLVSAFIFTYVLPFYTLIFTRLAIIKTSITLTSIFSACLFQWLIIKTFQLPNSSWLILITMVSAWFLSRLLSSALNTTEMINTEETKGSPP